MPAVVKDRWIGGFSQGTGNLSLDRMEKIDHLAPLKGEGKKGNKEGMEGRKGRKRKKDGEG